MLRRQRCSSVVCTERTGQSWFPRLSKASKRRKVTRKFCSRGRCGDLVFVERKLSGQSTQVHKLTLRVDGVEHGDVVRPGGVSKPEPVSVSAMRMLLALLVAGLSLSRAFCERANRSRSLIICKASSSAPKSSGAKALPSRETFLDVGSSWRVLGRTMSVENGILALKWIELRREQSSQYSIG